MNAAKSTLLASLGCFLLAETAVSEPIILNVSGLVSTHTHHTRLEREFYENLSKETGVDFVINFNPIDVLGVNMADTLRMAGDGTFDIVQSTLGNVSRDEPFVEAPDLMGVSPTMDMLREAVEAVRPAFVERLERQMNVRTLALWPYGPQLIFCKDPISGLSDLRGKRVRSYTRTMSALLEHVGATPVTLTFAEVYPSLQRGVIDCGITSITSANSGSWPEITSYVLTMGLNHGLQAHFMSLETFNAMTREQQDAVQAAFRKLENDMWELTATMYDDALRCSTGQEPCEHYTQFEMVAVDGQEGDQALLETAVDAVVLDVFARACQPTDECVAIWNQTVGAVRGFEMTAN